MRSSRTFVYVVILAISFAAACSDRGSKAPDVSDNIRRALDQAGLKDVKVSQDRDKGVVRLTGTAPSQGDKDQAESVARSIAEPQTVSNEISVRPSGEESSARKVDSDLDKGIDNNLEAMLIQHKLNHDVRYDVNNSVVTLKGTVSSEQKRTSAEKLAAQVPNVKQVVNEIEVKGQKATSTENSR